MTERVLKRQPLTREQLQGLMRQVSDEMSNVDLEWLESEMSIDRLRSRIALEKQNILYAFRRGLMVAMGGIAPELRLPDGTRINFELDSNKLNAKDMIKG